MNDHLLKASFGGCSLHNFFIDGVGADEPIDHDWTRLTDAVGAVLCL